MSLFVCDVVKFWISSFHVVCIVFCFFSPRPYCTAIYCKRKTSIDRARSYSQKETWVLDVSRTDVDGRVFSRQKLMMTTMMTTRKSGKRGEGKGECRTFALRTSAPTPHLPQHLPLENYRRGHLFPGPNPIPSITSNPILS